MARQYYEIQTQQHDGRWSAEGIGENNEFDSYEEAERALEGLLTDPDWVTDSNGVERSYRVRLVERP